MIDHKLPNKNLISSFNNHDSNKKIGFKILFELFNSLKSKNYEYFPLNNHLFRRQFEMCVFYERNFDCILRSDNQKYIGMIKENDDIVEMTGVGIYFYPNKDIYFGEFNCNLKSGNGIYIQHKNTNLNESIGNVLNTSTLSNNSLGSNPIYLYESFILNIGTYDDDKLVSNAKNKSLIIDYFYYSPHFFYKNIFNIHIGTLNGNYIEEGLSFYKPTIDDFVIYKGKYKNNIKYDNEGIIYYVNKNIIFTGTIEDNNLIKGFIGCIVEDSKVEKLFKVTNNELEDEVQTDEEKDKLINLFKEFNNKVSSSYDYLYTSIFNQRDNKNLKKDIFEICHFITIELINYLSMIDQKNIFDFDKIEVRDFLSFYKSILNNYDDYIIYDEIDISDIDD